MESKRTTIQMNKRYHGRCITQLVVHGVMRHVDIKTDRVVVTGRFHGSVEAESLEVKYTYKDKPSADVLILPMPSCRTTVVVSTSVQDPFCVVGRATIVVEFEFHIHY